MTLRLSRNQCEATLNLAGAEHVWVDAWNNAVKVLCYGMRIDGRVWKPTYTMGRRHRRLATFSEVMVNPSDCEVCEVCEGWSGWRIDELRMAVKQIVQGERHG